MTSPVTLVDYGSGNIFSVTRALETQGADVTLTGDPAVVRSAERVVLPGVGAFAAGMAGLREHGLADALLDFARRERPLLGICLGMQMLFEHSAEFGAHEGLGLIAGDITAIDPGDAGGARLKVPHIGWSALKPAGGRAWAATLLDGLAPGTRAYFVHSFTAVPTRDDVRLADTWYGSSRVSAAVQQGHIAGCQFHPEKSGPDGLAVIRRFLEL